MESISQLEKIVMRLEMPAECRDLFCREYTPGKGKKTTWKRDWIQVKTLPVMAVVIP